MYLADFLSFRNTVFPSKVCSKPVRVISRIVKIAILIHTFSSLVNMNTVHGLKNQVDCVRYFDRVAMWRRKVVVYDFIRFLNYWALHFFRHIPQTNANMRTSGFDFCKVNRHWN